MEQDPTRLEKASYSKRRACVDGPVGARGEARESDAVRLRSCVRPVCRGTMPLAQMGSAIRSQTEERPCWPPPYTGCADRRTDRSASFPCEPCTRGRRGSGSSRPGPVGLPARHHGPDDAGRLVGQSHRRELARLAAEQAQQPRRGGWPAGWGGPGLACWMSAVASSTSSCRSRSSPARLMPPRRCLPAIEHWRGTSPSQAAKCRADLNCVASTRSAKFSAAIGPIPGTAASRRLTGLALCCCSSVVSIARRRSSMRSASRPNSAIACLPPAVRWYHRPRRSRSAARPTLLAKRRHHPDLGGMAAHRVDQLSALPHQQLAHRQQHRRGLLLGRLDRTLAIEG